MSIALDHDCFASPCPIERIAQRKTTIPCVMEINVKSI